MDNVFLKVTDIEKKYQTLLLFSSFSYTFVPGNIYCFRGLSGCGKTTMLEILSGYLKPDKGSVVFSSDRKLKEEISYFSTDNEVFEELTAIENLSLVSSDKKRVLDVLQFIGLEKQKEIKGYNLSKGERARLAIGRFMLLEKTVLVFDEPIGNLDHKNAELVFRILNNIKKDHIIILSSNDDMGMESYCDVIFEHEDKSFHLKHGKENKTKLSSSEKKNQPMKYVKSFLKALFSRTWKQKLLLIPLLAFSLLSFCISYMFVQSYGNDYLYQDMQKVGMQGTVIKDQVEPSTYSANGFNIVINDTNCFAIFNEYNELDTSYGKRQVTSKNGLSLSSDMAKKLKVTIGSHVKINDLDIDFIVDEIYSYQLNEKELSSFIKQYDGLRKDNIFLYSNPILVSQEIVSDLVGMDTFVFSYGSDLLFKENEKGLYIPFYFKKISQNTYSFWKQKDEYNFIVKIIGYVSLSIFVFLSFLLFSSISFGFNKETILFHYIDGNNRRGIKITAIDAFISLFVSFFCSSVLSSSLTSVLNNFIVQFYEIQNYIPVLQHSGIAILLTLLLTLSVCILSFVFLSFVYHLKFIQNIKRKD